MMEVDGQSGHHAAESTTAEIRQRNACSGQHLPAGIIEKSRIVPDVHVSVVVAMRRHHDRAIHFEPILHETPRPDCGPARFAEKTAIVLRPGPRWSACCQIQTLSSVFGRTIVEL